MSGTIRDTDSVFVDLDQDGKIGAGEGLDIANGVASKSFRPGQFTTGGSWPVYYTPGGETDVKPGIFNTEISIEYDDASLVDPEAVSFVSRLAYFQVRTYAIPNAASNDIPNVRITCEAAGGRVISGIQIPGDMCTVFLDCNGEDGMEYFGELGSTVGAGETRVLRAADIGEALGIDSWAGCLSCNVLSYYHKVSVQVLVRQDQALHRLF